MSKVEWFRRTTWTDSDRVEFNSRLKRSRSDFHKAQYLRIQAVHLSEAGHYTAAIELLNRLFEEYPNEIGELESAHDIKAGSLVKLGKISDAINEYRASFEAHRCYPNLLTNACLDFGLLIVKEKMTDHYSEAISVLDEFLTKKDSDLAFPIMRFMYFTIKSIIAFSWGSIDDARQFARIAIEESIKRHSGFQYHANLGLVDDMPK